MKTIYLAGGCFWGVEAFFQRLAGVEQTTCGYANGTKEHPSYEEVCAGAYRFVECVKCVYDPDILTLNQILHAFFSIIDPISLNKQGGDIGIQYRTGIYWIDQADTDIILAFLNSKQTQYTQAIVTEVHELLNFYPAEAYHQDYLGNNPNGYCHVNLAKAYATVEQYHIRLKK